MWERDDEFAEEGGEEGSWGGGEWGVEAEGGAVVEDGDEGLSGGERFGGGFAEKEGGFPDAVYGRDRRASVCETETWYMGIAVS